MAILLRENKVFSTAYTAKTNHSVEIGTREPAVAALEKCVSETMEIRRR